MPDNRSSRDRMYLSIPHNSFNTNSCLNHMEEVKKEGQRPLAELVNKERDIVKEVQNVNKQSDMNHPLTEVQAEIAHVDTQGHDFYLNTTLARPSVVLSQKSEDEFVMRIIGKSATGVRVDIEVIMTASVALQHGINLTQMAATYMRKTRS